MKVDFERTYELWCEVLKAVITKMAVFWVVSQSLQRCHTSR
jgi:hypothetical protein